jgi:hypothetical protein
MTEEAAEKCEMGLVAQLAKRDSMKYRITLLPDRYLTAKSLGEHMVAIDELLRATAKDVGSADLTAFVSGLSYEDNAIEVTLSLLHTVKGELADVA